MLTQADSTLTRRPINIESQDIALRADALDKHPADSLIQLGLPALIPLEQSRLEALARARHRQIFNQAHAGAQVPRIYSKRVEIGLLV